MSQPKSNSRRSFLKLAATGAPVAAVAAVAGRTEQAEAAPVDQSGKREVVMQKTEHTDTYYSLARF